MSTLIYIVFSAMNIKVNQKCYTQLQSHVKYLTYVKNTFLFSGRTMFIIQQEARGL